MKEELNQLAVCAANIGTTYVYLGESNGYLLDQLDALVDATAKSIKQSINQWQPVSTAPLYRRILVASDCGSVVICVRLKGGWSIEGPIPESGDTYIGRFSITHWMEIPASPEAAE